MLDVWQGFEYAFWYQHCNVSIIQNFQREYQNTAKENRNEFNERNAGTRVKILSFIYYWQGSEATACNIIMNETLEQVFFKEFCKVVKNTLFTEYLWVTAFKEI